MNCNCKEPHCDNGHYPELASEEGDVNWVGCPNCVVDGVHLCDDSNKES